MFDRSLVGAPTALRNTWTFEVRADSLREAIARKLAHHQDRLEFWTNEQVDARADLRQNGVEVDLDDEDQASNSSYRGEMPNATVDPKRFKAVQQATQKVKEHAALAEDFQAWAYALKITRPDQIFNLTWSDVAYFDLAR